MEITCYDAFEALLHGCKTYLDVSARVVFEIRHPIRGSARVVFKIRRPIRGSARVVFEIRHPFRGSARVVFEIRRPSGGSERDFLRFEPPLQWAEWPLHRCSNWFGGQNDRYIVTATDSVVRIAVTSLQQLIRWGWKGVF